MADRRDPFEVYDAADGKIASFTLKYSSTRKEITDFYFRLWRSKLWKIHAFGFVVVLLSVIAAAGKWPPSPLQVIYGLIAAFSVVLCLFLFPQLKFKPQVRTIVFDQEGVKTTIGTKSGSIAWEQVREIEDGSDTIVILGKNLNAFLVPSRAFQSDEERSRVLAAIRAWQRGRAESMGTKSDG